MNPTNLVKDIVSTREDKTRDDIKSLKRRVARLEVMLETFRAVIETQFDKE